MAVRYTDVNFDTELSLVPREASAIKRFFYETMPMMQSVLMNSVRYREVFDIKHVRYREVSLYIQLSLNAYC